MYINTQAIKIVGGLRLHPKFTNIVHLAHHLCPSSAVTQFAFSFRKHAETFGRLQMERGTITVYLDRLFESACAYVQNPQTSMSLRARTWLYFIIETLRQFRIACRLSGHPLQADLTGVTSIISKDPELGQLVAFAGCRYDIEPPLLKQDPFFGPKIENVIHIAERQAEPWAARQRELITRICSFPMGMRLSPFSLRDYFKWATGNCHNPDWPQYVPSFNADADEILQVEEDNRDWQRHLDEMAREKARLDREMDLLDRFEEKIASMSPEK